MTNNRNRAEDGWVKSSVASWWIGKCPHFKRDGNTITGEEDTRPGEFIYMPATSFAALLIESKRRKHDHLVTEDLAIICERDGQEPEQTGWIRSEAASMIRAEDIGLERRGDHVAMITTRNAEAILIPAGCFAALLIGVRKNDLDKLVEVELAEIATRHSLEQAA